MVSYTYATGAHEQLLDLPAHWHPDNVDASNAILADAWQDAKAEGYPSAKFIFDSFDEQEDALPALREEALLLRVDDVDYDYEVVFESDDRAAEMILRYGGVKAG